MEQCKAKTREGARCKSKIVPPSRSLCKRHQDTVARGTEVVNFDTGRKFPRSKP